MMWKDLPTPCYVADEKKLKENLRILQKLEKDTGCHVLLAQKAFSMFSLYPMIGTFISGTTASGLYEARLGREEMGKENHVFAPAYKEADMKELVKICDHIVFNSFRQYEKYKELCKQSAQIREDGKPVSVGIRVNPECSTQEGHEIYDPCGPGSRLGVTKAEFREDLLEGVEGLHFHTLCEQDADDLVITFRAFEEKFGKYLKKMKWLNLGGGHHITRPGYQLKQLKQLIAYIRATSALLVDVRTSDFPDSEDPLSGVDFQEKYERLAFRNGGGDYTAPKTTWAEFRDQSASAEPVIQSLPEFASASIREAVPHFGRKLKGFDADDAVMTAVESRSSSPVRILRDREQQCVSVRGLYPGGEGAGYAGGITSSACDGIKIAEQIITSFSPCKENS